MALLPLARLGLKALDTSREGRDYDGGEIQEAAEQLGVVVQTPVGPGTYCGTDDENSNCICAESGADFCSRDSEGTALVRPVLAAKS
jgi:hypothetical protein